MKVRFRARRPKPPSAPNSVGRAHLFIFKLPLPPLWFSPLAPPARRSAAYPSPGHHNMMPNCLDAPLGSARRPTASMCRLIAPGRLRSSWRRPKPSPTTASGHLCSAQCCPGPSPPLKALPLPTHPTSAAPTSPAA
jgi:hypothetical protein